MPTVADALLDTADIAKQAMHSPRHRRRPPPTTDTAYRTALEYVFAKTGREILAYLQYTINCDQPVEFFLRTVVSHFRKTLQLDVRESQIEDQLKLLWQCSRAPNRTTKGWKDDLNRGIGAFPGLGPDRIAWVQARAIQLKVDLEQSPRRLRSDFQTPSPARLSAKRRLDTSKTHGRRKSRRSEIGNTVSKKKQSVSVEVPLSRSRQRQLKTPPDDDTGPGENSDFDTDAEGQSSPLASRNQRYSPTTTQAESEAEHCQLQKQATDVQTCQNCIRSQLPQHGSGVEVNVAQLRWQLEAARARITQLDIEVDELKIQEAETMCRWKSSVAELDEAERQIKNLQVESPPNDVEIANQNVELDVQVAQLRNRNIGLRMENDRIRKQRDLLQTSQRFVSDKWKKFEHLDVQEVLRDVDELKSKVKRFMQGLDLLFSKSGQNVAKQSCLAALFRGAFGADINASEENWMSVPDISGFKLRVVLISLASAALRMWIFDADIQDIFTNNGIAYAKLTILLTSADKVQAERIKFATHKLCNDDVTMTDESIPRRAAYYSRRFFRSIKPLLEAHKIDGDGAASDAESLAADTQHLTEIFTIALRVKIRLLLTTGLYQCFCPAPGTTFDEVSMQAWPEESSAGQIEGDTKRVAVAVFPGLAQIAVDHQTFTYNRFVSGDTTPGVSRWLSRALVVAR